MFIDELFNDFNSGTIGAPLNNQLGGYAPWMQAGGYMPGINQLGGYSPGGLPGPEYSGALGMLNYANSPLGGPASPSNFATKPLMIQEQMGMLGRLPVNNGMMRGPRNRQQFRQIFGPMSLGRMGMNAY